MRDTLWSQNTSEDIIDSLVVAVPGDDQGGVELDELEKHKLNTI